MQWESANFMASYVFIVYALEGDGLSLAYSAPFLYVETIIAIKLSYSESTDY